MVGSRTGGIDACVDGLNGNNIQDVHSKCIPDPTEVVCNGGRDTDCKADPTGFRMTGEYIGAGFHYIGSLITDRTNAGCAEMCTYKSPYRNPDKNDPNPTCKADTSICGGQRYVTKFGKCKDISNETQDRYIYKGVKLLEGGSISKTLQATARPFYNNRFDNVFSGTPMPPCTKVRLRCSVLGPNNKPIGGKPGSSKILDTESVKSGTDRHMYGGENTGEVHIADDELQELANEDLIINDHGSILDVNMNEKKGYGFNMITSEPPNNCDNKGRETFENILNDINSLNLDNLDNLDNLVDNNNFSTSIAEELYFILLSIFLCYIIYKIIYKK
jgi:hypothetical protein